TRVLKVDRIRIFDFWRLDDKKPDRAGIYEKLTEASNKAAKRGITLLLENEPSCNTATGAEAARTLGVVRSAYLKLNWDPGNAASVGEIAYPDGYSHLPKKRLGYMHCKAVTRGANGKCGWMKVGGWIRGKVCKCL